MSRGMAELSALDIQIFTATSGIIDLSYPWLFVDGVTDEIYGAFHGTFQHIDPNAPIVFRALARTAGSPSGQVGVMAIAYKILRRGANVASAYMPNLTFQAFDFSANKNPGLIDTEFRWIEFAELPAGTFQEGDRVAIRFRRDGGNASDTLGTNLIIHENGFSWFYPVMRPGGLG